jgi:hypothetical protein
MNELNNKTKAPCQTPTLEFFITTEFGDRAKVILDLYDSSIDSVFQAVRQALAGCGYSKESIDEWFPEEE